MGPLIPHELALSVWTWLRRLGGPGLILLGIADNSVVPLPGSMDVFTIILAANHREWWFYYAAMATAGAVLGGYLTYRLGREGGKDTLEKKLPKDKAQKIYKKFEHAGFWSITVPAMLPPPVPIVPFLLAAGALHYSRKKFLASLAVGRGIRFTVVAFIAAHFGTQIFQFFSKYYKPALYSLIALAVVGGLAAVWWYLRYRRRHSRQTKGRNTQSKRSERKVA